MVGVGVSSEMMIEVLRCQQNALEALCGHLSDQSSESSTISQVKDNLRSIQPALAKLEHASSSDGSIERRQDKLEADLAELRLSNQTNANSSQPHEPRISTDTSRFKLIDVSANKTSSSDKTWEQAAKKLAARVDDMDAKFTGCLRDLRSDLERKINFVSTNVNTQIQDAIAAAKDAKQNASGKFSPPEDDTHSKVESGGVNASGLQFAIADLKSVVDNLRVDHGHLKRVLLACERDMEDFRSSMDAINVDLDEIRANVDSTHSIMTARQRAEANLSAELSTLRLDMDDFAEGLRSHDTWMEDVSQSLTECHENVGRIVQDNLDHAALVSEQLGKKVDHTTFNARFQSQEQATQKCDNDIKGTKRDLESMRGHISNIRKDISAWEGILNKKLAATAEGSESKAARLTAKLGIKVDDITKEFDAIKKEYANQLSKLNLAIKDSEDQHKKHRENLATNVTSVRKTFDMAEKSLNERTTILENKESNVARDFAKRLSAVDLRISG